MHTTVCVYVRLPLKKGSGFPLALTHSATHRCRDAGMKCFQVRLTFTYICLHLLTLASIGFHLLTNILTFTYIYIRQNFEKVRLGCKIKVSPKAYQAYPFRHPYVSKRKPYPSLA